ncbi:hypothetical protein D3C85_1795110 [compost metagenome]
MTGILRFIGALVLTFYVLAWLDVVDFYLCVGQVGTCTTRSAPGDALPRSSGAI